MKRGNDAASAQDGGAGPPASAAGAKNRGFSLFLHERAWKRGGFFLATQRMTYDPKEPNVFRPGAEHRLYNRTVLLLREADNRARAVASLDWTTTRVRFVDDPDAVWAQMNDARERGQLTTMDTVWPFMAERLRRRPAGVGKEEQEVVYVDFLWTDPEQRKQGHGRRLLEMMLESWLFDWGFDRVELMPDPNAGGAGGAPGRVALWDFYRRVGFRADPGRTAWTLVQSGMDKKEVLTVGIKGTFDYLQAALKINDRRGKLAARLADLGNDHRKIASTLSLLQQLSNAVATRANLEEMCRDGCEAFMAFDLLRDPLPPPEKHGRVPTFVWQVEHVAPRLPPWQGGDFMDFLCDLSTALPAGECWRVPLLPAAPPAASNHGEESAPGTPELTRSGGAPLASEPSDDDADDKKEAFELCCPAPASTQPMRMIRGTSILDVLEEIEKSFPGGESPDHVRPTSAMPAPCRSAARKRAATTAAQGGELTAVLSCSSKKIKI